MSALQFAKFLRAFYFIILLSFVYIIALIVMCWTSNSYCMQVLDGEGNMVESCDMYSFGATYGIIQAAVLTVLITCMLVVGFIFLVEYHRTERAARTAEQRWTIVIVVFTTLAIVPWVSILEGVSRVDFAGGSMTVAAELSHFVDSTVVQSFFIYITSYFGLLFFGWCTAASYRSIGKTPTSLIFYLPKIGCLLAVVALRVIMAATTGIRPAKTPTATLPLIIISFIVADRTESYSTLALGLIFGFAECFIVMEVFFEIHQTKMFLKGVNYLKTRSKQVGFQFFVFHFSSTLVAMVILEIFFIVAAPFGNIGAIAQYAGYFMFDVFVGDEVRAFVLVAFTVQTAMLNSPARILHFRDQLHKYTVGLFRPRKGSHDETSLQLEKVELLKFFYMVPESKSADARFIEGDVIMSGVRTFSLDSMVQMYNCAWLTFSYGKEGKKTRTPPELGDAHYNLVEYISSSKDTHALVLEGNGRIVVAFKGTTSFSNMTTDVKFQLVDLELLFNFDPGSTLSIEEPGIAPPAAALWRRYCPQVCQQSAENISQEPKIHSGFLHAYLTVAQRIETVVTMLYTDQPRPIFFTGHSLGGALSTLCSYSLHRKLKLSQDNIACYTFGSPMVGNNAFVRKYNSKIPRHWRIILAGDAVTKLPVGAFEHVGFKALLDDEAGMLFIDPSLMELTLNHSKRTSLGAHVKSRYEKGIRALCANIHKVIRPIFWSTTAKSLIEEEKNVASIKIGVVENADEPEVKRKSKFSNKLFKRSSKTQS